MHGSGGQQVLAWEFETKTQIKTILETRGIFVLIIILFFGKCFWSVFQSGIEGLLQVGW